MPENTPFSTPTPQARQMAQGMIAQADHAALASLGPDGVQPSVSRIALAPGDGGVVLSLLSDLAPHKVALRATLPARCCWASPVAGAIPWRSRA